MTREGCCTTSCNNECINKSLVFRRIVMFNFIKRLTGRHKRKSILRDIKDAKAMYLSGSVMYMCQCFYRVDKNRYKNYEKIRKRIPEFKPSTFNVDPNDIKGAWWPTRDKDSRIKAFDKLIEIYSK